MKSWKASLGAYLSPCFPALGSCTLLACLPAVVACPLRSLKLGWPDPHAPKETCLEQVAGLGDVQRSLPQRTASQNHRLFGVGRDLWGSPSPTPLQKQGHPEQAAQDCVRAGREYLQRRRLHNLPGQPVPVHPNYVL